MELPKQLEQEIADIARKIGERAPEQKSGQESIGQVSLAPSREVAHEVIGEKIKEIVLEKQSDASLSPPPIETGAHVGSPQSEELRSRVQELVQIVYRFSLEDAIRQAIATNNAALVDEFHDTITDELLPRFLEAGKLENLQ